MMKANPIRPLQIAGLLILALCFQQEVIGSTPHVPRTPNIIVILADDMGFGDVHAFYPESEIPTPNLDKLAMDGMMFTDAHTPSAICTPTRYGLLTGRYCWRTELKSGVLTGYDPPLIKEEQVTIADYLNRLGYQTGIVGKWHLGLEFQRNIPGEDSAHEQFDLTKPLLHTPNKDGFDFSFILPASLDFEPYLYVRNYDVVDQDFERVPTTKFPHFWREGIKSKSLEFDQVMDDLLLEAKGFIERASKSDDPFFLYFPLTAPHKPVSPAERFVGISGRGLYGDFVSQVDWTAGEILNLLEELGLEDNTLVIFTSDNGSPMYSMNAETYPDHVTDETLAYYNERHHRANGHLRGIKGDLFEGGHRVPFIVRWPGKIPRDTRTSETICLTDIFDTIVEITGGEKPAGNAEDSYSFAGQLLGGNEIRNRPPVVHHAGGAGMYAIRKDQWKLILGNGSGARTDPVGRPFRKPYQLFNLDHDLSESVNLIDLAPGLAEDLESEFRAIEETQQAAPKGDPAPPLPAYASPERVGRLVTEDLLSRETMIRADKSGIHYAEICTADGAITFADLIGDEQLSARLEERYACFLEKENCSIIPAGEGFRYQAGMIVFGMYSHNRDPRYLEIALDLVQDKWDLMGDPNSESDLFQRARFWSDDMYFTASLDPRIYRVTGDPKCLDRPANWLIGYIDRLQLPNGLFKHTTEVPFIWGRGVGWAAVGLTNTLQDMPLNHPKRSRLLASFRKLMAGLKPYQSQNGLWRQLIDDPDSWEETSGTAMFTYAMATGIREGWLDPQAYGPILRKGWLGLVDQLDDKGRLMEVCIGTNEKLTAQDYLDRRRVTGDYHGQAPMLWTANALMLMETGGKPDHNTLSQKEQNAGWELLWDGKTSKGWRAIYLDHFPQSGWIIERGQLICLGEELPEEERGGAIITDKKYGSFELSFEFQIGEGANSGIKYFVDESLKASMGHGLGLEFAILDDNNFPYDDPDAKRTCGSLYDLVKAAPGATLPIGEWNRGRIVVRGNQIEHWLNGKRVMQVEKGTPHYYALVSESKYKNIKGWGEVPSGHILIQDEGPRAAFRNIKVRVLDQN